LLWRIIKQIRAIVSKGTSPTNSEINFCSYIFLWRVVDSGLGLKEKK
jgi:hypothetical protein